MSKILTKTAKYLHQLAVSSIPPNTARLASTFKTAVIKEIGKPIVIEEHPVTKLKSNQVRVQVSYCSVNSVDCHKFKHGGGQLPFIPGYELSGEVLEKGKDVSDEDIRIGERVAGLNLETFGGLAEQCVLDKDDIWRIPGELEKKEVAVITYGHSSAIYAFSKICPLKENEKVLISAGPAGLGLAAVDVAANVYKAKVIGLVDDQELAELVRKSGAFETLTFGTKLVKQCLKMTENKGVNVVYDAVGEQMLETIGSCISMGGKVLYATPVFYKTIPAPVPHSFSTILSLKELRRQNRHLYKTVVNDTLELANEGLIGAHVSAKFSLCQINEAVKFVEEKKCTGKVVIEIDD